MENEDNERERKGLRGKRSEEINEGTREGRKRLKGWRDASGAECLLPTQEVRSLNPNTHIISQALQQKYQQPQFQGISDPRPASSAPNC